MALGNLSLAVLDKITSPKCFEGAFTGEATFSVDAQVSFFGGEEVSTFPTVISSLA